MKEIDSDVKIAELYKELRDEGMRDKNTACQSSKFQI